ncbi:MAG: YHS domain-containing protein [Bacteroidota bacterium]
MRRSVWAMVAVVAVVGLMALAGCGERKETALQGAPSANAPAPPAPAPAAPSETHTMPGGKTMTNEEMKGMEQKPATTATSAKEDMATCPVLGTTMSKEKMLPYEYKGKTYYFCCPPCVEKFKKDPEKYLKNPAPAKPAGEGMGG